MPKLKPALLASDVSQFLGSYVLTPPTGLVTVLAAGTATAGQLLALRWATAAKFVLLRYLAARFVTTTAFTTPQEVGCEAFVARAFTVAGTGGTALAVVASNKLATSMPDSLLNDGRISTTTALTAGTQTLDSQAFGQCSGFSSAVGATIPKEALFDARDGIDPTNGVSSRSPIVLAASEGIIVRNTVLMGAAGVGRWQFYVEYDEVAA